MIAYKMGCGLVVAAAALLGPVCASAAEIAVAGIFGSKAVLVVNGGVPRTLGVGQKTPEGIRLVAIEGEVAVVELAGVRERIRLGDRVVQRGSGTGGETLYLEADSQGHFFVNGQIDGGTVRFLVDTGASVISLGRSDAMRLGINLAQAAAGTVQTASGVSRVWRVKLDSVRVGAIVLNGVDAVVLENDLPLALLGMSFLNRMEMSREGSRLALKRRY